MYANREDAGVRLAYRLQEFLEEEFKGMVLATSRGGVVVGHTIAQHLSSPLGFISIKNISVPGMPELSMGAVDRLGAYSINPNMAPFLDPLFFQAERLKSIRMADNETVSIGINPDLPYNLEGMDIIVADDGAQPLTTLLAIVDTLELHDVENIYMAIPVMAHDDVICLEREVDALVVDLIPSFSSSAGEWYATFPWENDEKVREILQHYNLPEPKPLKEKSSGRTKK